MTDKANNTNKNSQITDIVPEDELDNIFTSLTEGKPKDKQYKFYLYYLFGFPIKTCADKAGYAESTGYAMVQRYKKQPKLRQSVDQILNMFPDRYRSVCKLRLPQIAEIEGKALQEYEDTPKLAIDKPQLLKQVKAGAGILSDEQQVTRQTINVGSIQNLMLQMQEGTKQISDNGEVIEAETE